MTAPSNNEGLFRKEALEQASDPEELRTSFRPVSYRKGFIIGTLLLLCSLFVAWLFLGSIPIPLLGRGIVMNRQGLFSVEAKVDGIIKEILVTPGMQVKKGDLLVRMTDPSKENQYQSALIKYQKLQQNIAILRSEIEKEELARRESVQKQIASSIELISHIENIIKDLEQQYQEKEALFKEKFLGLRQIYEAKQLLSKRRIELETTRGSLAAYEANLVKSYLQQELLVRQQDLLTAKQEVDSLKLSLAHLDVFSNQEGLVLEVLVNIHENVTVGTPLVRLEYGMVAEQSYVIYAYVSPETAKLIEKGTQVQIELSTVRAEEYGSIIGTIKEISLFPISKIAIGNKIQNPGLVDYLMENNKIVAQLLIEPELDSTTPSGYHWTSGAGPDIKVSLGTVSTVKGIAGRVRPLYYLISLWRLEKLQTSLEEYFKKTRTSK